MKSNVMERTVADVLGEALAAADDGLFVVAPDAETIKRLVQVVDEASPSVRLLAEPTALKTVMDDFLLASRAADRVDAGVLEIRNYDEGANALVVTDDSVMAVVNADGHVAGLTTNDEAFIESANARFSEAWRNAEPYVLRTPPLSKVRETLEAELGARTAEDFDAVLSALDADDGGRSDLDEVTVSLLVAAKNEDLLYDISKWGEDVGIASKATFSRTKTRMEEQGVIETEKVPIDVGRPRLRLKLGDERLEDVDTEAFARVARAMLAA
ncbi:MAG: transcriptional regulator TbsP [Halobacteriota archaeon]|uniref:transcriptional regulator TbsP n=1 Tax=Natronomonas sp. TaxID=2184060 RepID=UPI0039767D33